MSDTSEMHDLGPICPKCGKRHSAPKLLGIKIEKQDADEMSLILNKLSCARQASDIKNIPEFITQDKMNKFVLANMEALSAYQWLEQDWWNRMKVKYNLPAELLNKISVDTNALEFTLLE